MNYHPQIYQRNNCSYRLVRATIRRTKTLTIDYHHVCSAKQGIFFPQTNAMNAKTMQAQPIDWRRNSCDSVPHIALIDSYFVSSVWWPWNIYLIHEQIFNTMPPLKEYQDRPFFRRYRYRYRFIEQNFLKFYGTLIQNFWWNLSPRTT